MTVDPLTVDPLTVESPAHLAVAAAGGTAATANRSKMNDFIALRLAGREHTANPR